MQELSSSAEELSILAGDRKVVIDEFILNSKPRSSMKAGCSTKIYLQV
ncbi:MAG: hypothetical protein RBT65_18545 [Methanolobus sp.]|jgi:hypothetical protein|nr:hypothetical protein [Methanolobus sp.]